MSEITGGGQKAGWQRQEVCLCRTQAECERKRQERRLVAEVEAILNGTDLLAHVYKEEDGRTRR